VSARDVLQIALGAVMIPLGITIVVRVFSVAPSVLGVFVGAAFVALGAHRLWLAGRRLRDLRRRNHL
jgi:hypothetical protein